MTWEPVLSPETIGKHQILDDVVCTTVLAKHFKYGHPTKDVAGVEPFKRVKFVEVPGKEFA